MLMEFLTLFSVSGNLIKHSVLLNNVTTKVSDLPFLPRTTYSGGVYVIITNIMTQKLPSGWLHTFKFIKKSRCSFTVSRSNSTLCWGQSPRLSRIASISVMILFPSM